ncbi:MAG: hypothetical protein J7L62_04185 [Candidatus Aminicenantes bacterium]|nr:hypothetical protein [Candidatus Aminicenantes bacterium]
MQKFKPSLTVILMVLLIAPFSLKAQEKFSGVVFGEYYYMLSNHNPGIEGMNGFWFRRLYFTYDHKFGSRFKIRVRFEANSRGDFSTKEKIVPYVKDLYIQWSKNGQSIIIGISPTPTFSKVEKFWGYRAVEKTPLDLYKMAHSRDTGIAFKGELARKRVHYHFMFANGEGNKSEFNKQKKIMGAIGIYPSKKIYVEFYSDFEKGPVGSTNVYTLQGFIGFTTAKFTLGALYSSQVHQMDEEENLNLRVLSLTARYTINEKFTVLGRYDRMMDPLPYGPEISYLPLDSVSPFNLFIAGIDYRVNKNFSIIPNVEFVRYDELDTSDLMGKLTFSYKW